MSWGTKDRARQGELDLVQVAAPSVAYRPVPLWSWNETLESDEVRRQVRELAQGGMGGAFMHVRLGLLTPYMSGAFFAAIEAALDEAQALGLKMYLYDEDRWPSGWAGGAVPLRDANFRLKWLLRVPAGESAAEGENLSLLADDGDGTRYYRYVSPLGSAWYSGTTYADLMDERTVQAFLEEAYEPYARRFGTHFGTLIPAIFTDEPAISALPSFCNVPRGMLFWTDELPTRFSALHGYDLLPHLAELFDDVGDYTATRTDYYRTCAWLFEHHFSAQVGEWCNRHGIALTGHYIFEDSLVAALGWNASILPHYRHFSWPGVDHLGRQIREVITTLGCRSVVNQYSKSRMMSELYGCSGQHLSFEDRKWIAEQQIVLGVNLLVPHLLLYTMAGERKRDYPCNMWYQQPWWPLNAVVDDYLAQLCTLMAQGTMVPELLVLHPQESLYPVRRPIPPDEAFGFEWTALYPRADRERIAVLDEGFQDLSHTLLAQQRSFDYGDETLLADSGVVETSGARPLLRVGAMAYPLVVLPTLTSLRATTLTLLEQFAAAGGPVLASGMLPTLVDGRSDQQERLAKFLKDMVWCVAPEDLERTLTALVPPLVAVDVTGPRHWLWQQTRQVGSQSIILMVNLSRQEAITGTLRLAVPQGPVYRLRLSDQTYSTLADGDGPLSALALHLEPGESLVLLAGPGDLAPFSACSEDAPHKTEEVLLEGWEGERLDENALTLDMATFGRGGEALSESVPVIAIQHVLNSEHYDGPLMLQYTFLSALDGHDLTAEQALYLVLEHPEHCTIRVNGQEVEYAGLPWWRDRRWLPIAIGQCIQRGNNTIDLTYADFRYGDATSVADQARRYGTEIEAIYLVGDFAVAVHDEKKLATIPPPDPTSTWTLCEIDPPFVIESTRPLTAGNLVAQGLPFYAGRITLRTRTTLPGYMSGRVWLEMERLSVPVVGVRVNGQEAGALAWRPYRLEVGELLKEGENTIELVMYHSLRNLLGPHHSPHGEPYRVEPSDFRGSGDDWASRLIEGGSDAPDWRASYAVTECGLLGEVHLVNEKQ